MKLNPFHMKAALTREKVKLSVVVCWVRVNVALSVSHDPAELVSLGVRLTNDCIVWEGRDTHILFQVSHDDRNDTRLILWVPEPSFTLFCEREK